MNSQRNDAENDNKITCWKCGKSGHIEHNYCSRGNNQRLKNNYASKSRSTQEPKRLCVMQHMMNTMFANVSCCGDNVWYVDLGALNHMTSHVEWFKSMQTLDNLGYM